VLSFSSAGSVEPALWVVTSVTAIASVPSLPSVLQELKETLAAMPRMHNFVVEITCELSLGGGMGWGTDRGVG
jgi:hypothetical protein